MKKFPLLVALVLLANVSGVAKNKISAYSRAVYGSYATENVQNIPSKSILKKHGNQIAVNAFIETNTPDAVKILESNGVKVASVFGNMLTARIVLADLEKISELDCVEWIELAKRVDLKNDAARSFYHTNQESVQKGVGLDRPYKGKGVIYGSLDTGIDFNHVAFKDPATGNSRMLYVYLPENESGNKAVGNVFDIYGNVTPGGEFPGSEFPTASVSKLTTDYRDESHGTHTHAIGAGGYMGNNFYGMAPEADIISCASMNMDEVDVINSVSYIFGKAEELGQPAVVNLSLGVNLGAHDGTSYVPRIIDQLTGEGKIVVISAGNEGDVNMHINRKYTSATDSLKTFFATDGGTQGPNFNNLSSSYGSNDFELWSRTDLPYKVKVIIYDKSSGVNIYESKEFVPSKDGNELNLGFDFSDAKFNNLFRGTVALTGAYDNNKYNVYGEISGRLKDYSYRLGLVVTAENGSDVDLWTDCYGLVLDNDNVDGFTGGSADMSINDWATGNSGISVGAYSSRDTWKSVDGMEYRYPLKNAVEDIAYFSSYGVDANGISRPDIVAPGHFVISAVNGYDSYYKANGYYRSDVAVEETINGKKERWAIMSGTSMSSPCVAGIIATWLEANPKLTPDDIKQIFAQTAMKDNYVTGGNAVKWGAGKINAYNGLVQAIEMASVEDVVRDSVKPVVVYPNPNNGQFSFVLPGNTGDAVLNVYDVNGTLSASETFENVGAAETHVDLSGSLESGIYLLQFVSNNNVYTSRLVIR